MTRIIRDIRALHPVFRQRALALVEAVTAEGLPFAVYETLRSPERQDAGKARGVSKLAAWAGKHQLGMAIDLVGQTPSKRWTWANNLPWKRYGELVRAQGLTWGGDWKGLVDCPHAEHPTRWRVEDVTAPGLAGLEWSSWALEWLLPLCSSPHPANARVLTLLAQGAATALGHRLVRDGVWGPITEQVVARAGGGGTRPERVAAMLGWLKARDGVRHA